MDQSPPKESRPPINLRIKFRSESVEQFIERYAVDVSRGGIFIRTREPLAVGTQLKLDFQFQNGGALMSGDGTVVWIREVDPNRTSVPPGMGVRFDKLTPEGQAVLEQLLVEKAKRERGGVPGSGGQGAGGIAVRRPSSMFSVLEPQVTASAVAKVDKATPSVAAPSVAATPATAPTAAPATSASIGYRPLGTARNPFSAVTGTGAAVSPTPASSPDTGSSRPTGPRTSQRLTPTDDAAPFDDMNDEPTQIAGRLPSFLTSDEEATTVAPLALAGAPREAPQQPTGLGGGTSTENPKTPPPEPRRIPTGLGMKVQPDRKTGAQAAIPGATAPPRQKQSLDQVPPFAGEAAQQPAKEPSRDTAKDLATTGAASTPDQKGARERDQETENTPLPVTGAGAPPAAAVAVIPSGPGAVAAPPSSTASARATSAGAKVAPVASPAHAATQQAAKVQPVRSVKKRSPAALVGLTVIVLGASAIFVFRFFGSQATEPVSPSSAPAGVVATGEPTAITGPPSVPAAEATNPPPIPSSPSSAGASTDPTGTGTPAAALPPPAPEPAGAGAPAEPTVTKPASPASDTAPRAPVADVKTDAPGGQKGGKAKPARGSRDTGAATTASAPAPAEPKAAQPAAAPVAAATAPPAVATAPPTAATAPPAGATAPPAAEPEATAHQIRITSKPAGADIALDGQTIGKTPYSIGIADVSAPHFIAVRKDGFEPFEQMISASSTWTKTKAAKGKPALQVLKINAKLKQVGGGGAASPGGASAGGEPKPATEPPAPEADPASKVEVVRPDRPLPPSEDRAPAESPP